MLSQCPCSGNGGGNPILLIAIFAGAWLLFNWIKTVIKSKGISFMNKTVKIIIVIVLIVAVGIVIAVKQKNSNIKTETSPLTNPDSASLPKNIEPNGNPQNTDSKVSSSIPKLIDLGADKCIPCKMMKPVLDELRIEYKGIFDVVFIDVWKDPAPGKTFGIRVIPTQVFLDPNGKELFRHEGFFSKEDILAKWKGFGINLEKGTSNEKN
jgi:thioredoxin 1